MSISVVIPAYDAGAYLHKALESVFNQTVPVDEIIIVDDGSKDNTCEVARSYGERVRLLSQKNQGASAARNFGVQSAKFDLIAFLDADDRWFPEKIEKQLQAFKANPKAILCYTSMTELKLNGTQALVKAPAIEKIAFELRLGNPGLTPTCIMLSRAKFLAVGGFHVDQIVGEDWDLWRRLLAVGPFCVVEEPTVYYQSSNTGLSSNPDELYREGQRMVDNQLLDEFHGISKWIWRRRILSHQAFRAALTARSCRQQQKEIHYLRLSLQTWPSPFWDTKRFKFMAITLRNLLRKPARAIG